MNRVESSVLGNEFPQEIGYLFDAIALDSHHLHGNPFTNPIGENVRCVNPFVN